MSVSNLDHYWILVTIGFFCSFLPLLFLWLIPTRADIEKLQTHISDDAAYEKENEKAQSCKDQELSLGET